MFRFSIPRWSMKPDQVTQLCSSITSGLLGYKGGSMPEFGTFRIFPGFEAPKCKFVHSFVIIFTNMKRHEHHLQTYIYHFLPTWDMNIITKKTFFRQFFTEVLSWFSIDSVSSIASLSNIDQPKQGFLWHFRKIMCNDDLGISKQSPGTIYIYMYDCVYLNIYDCIYIYMISYDCIYIYKYIHLHICIYVYYIKLIVTGIWTNKIREVKSPIADKTSLSHQWFTNIASLWPP